MEYKKETTEERFGRVATRILAIGFGLIGLFVVATVGWETFTMEDATALRTVAMMGFIGWFFVFLMSMRPRKQ